ncbi:MAG: type II toxin-antitoxin system PemK/MazF family toxin [Acidobacteriota bacterium]
MTPQNPPSTPKCKRGDVILAPYPNSNLQSAKLRPALVIQADNLNTGLPQAVVAMISSNLARTGHPSRVLILPSTWAGRQSGLLADSVVLTDNLATISFSAILRVIGTMPMAAVDAALRHTFSL